MRFFPILIAMLILASGCITSKGKKLTGVVPTGHGTYRLQSAIDREKREAAEKKKAEEEKKKAEEARQKALLKAQSKQVKLPPARSKPVIPAPQSEQLFIFSDKLLHFFSFMILLFLFDKAFDKPISLITLGLLFSYALFLEFIQSLTLTRSAEIYDLMADALGLLVYFIFAPKLKKRNKVL